MTLLDRVYQLRRARCLDALRIACNKQASMSTSRLTYELDRIADHLVIQAKAMRKAHDQIEALKCTVKNLEEHIDKLENPE